MALEVFYSYAHEDEELRTRIEKALSMLRREGLISDWHDRKIGAGSDWKAEIDAHVRSAHMILLFVMVGRFRHVAVAERSADPAEHAVIERHLERSARPTHRCEVTPWFDMMKPDVVVIGEGADCVQVQVAAES